MNTHGQQKERCLRRRLSIFKNDDPELRDTPVYTINTRCVNYENCILVRHHEREL